MTELADIERMYQSALAAAGDRIPGVIGRRR
jgi:hypothetical protein